MLCLNVLEYLDDPRAVLQSLRAHIETGRRDRGAGAATDPPCSDPSTAAWAISAAMPRLNARQLLEAQGLRGGDDRSIQQGRSAALVDQQQDFGSGKLSKPLLKTFDKTVWIWRRLDRLIPWPGLSLIAVARNREPAPRHRRRDPA